MVDAAEIVVEVVTGAEVHRVEAGVAADPAADVVAIAAADLVTKTKVGRFCGLCSLWGRPPACAGLSVPLFLLERRLG